MKQAARQRSAPSPLAVVQFLAREASRIGDDSGGSIATADELHHDVYVKVFGSGEIVDDWFTQTYYYPIDGPVCPRAVLYEERFGVPSTFESVQRPCFDPPPPGWREFLAYWSIKMPAIFDDGDLLCARWDSHPMDGARNDFPGTPCIGVHA